MRDSTIFYRSFYEAIKELPKENQLEIYNAIFEHSLNNVTPKLTGLSKTIYILIEPQIEANLKRFIDGKKGGEHGKKGGRPPKVKPKKNPIGDIKKTPIGDIKENPIETPNNNNNVNNNDNYNDSKNDILLLDASHPINKFISDKLFNVSKMKIQLSFEDCENLKTEFNSRLIYDTLLAMENHKNLVKNNLSVNLTIRNWIRRNKKEIAKSNLDFAALVLEKAQTIPCPENNFHCPIWDELQAKNLSLDEMFPYFATPDTPLRKEVKAVYEASKLMGGVTPFMQLDQRHPAKKLMKVYGEYCYEEPRRIKI